VLGLLGPLGAGQSILLQILAGRLKPDTGRVEIAGTAPELLDEPLQGLETPEERRTVATMRARATAERRPVVVATSLAWVAAVLCDQVAVFNQGRLMTVVPGAAVRQFLEAEFYRIRVKGHLDGRRAAWFEGMSLHLTDRGETVMTGPVADQAALHGLLARVRDLGVPLLEVVQTEPDLSPLWMYPEMYPPGT
jgi:ABC-type multidrug transport system ATPase subunit